MKEDDKGSMFSEDFSRRAAELVPPLFPDVRPAHHPKYAPSSLHRVFSCHASVILNAGRASARDDGAEEDDDASKDALEGRKLHSLVEKCYRGMPFEEGLDVEQIECVEKSVRYVKSLQTPAWSETVFDVPVDVGWTYGTADCVVLNEVPTVVDFKFGRDDVESVEDNPQLAVYGVGVSLKYGAKSCVVAICQPRINNYSHYVFGNIPDIALGLEREMAKVEDSPWLFAPSRRNCHYCKAKLGCVAYRHEFESLVGDSSGIESISAEDMPRLLDICSLVNPYVESIKERAMELMNSGVSVLGWTIGVGKKDRSIRDIEVCFEAVKELVPNETFIKLCKVSVPGLETAVADAIVAMYAKKGNKITKKDALSAAKGILEPVMEYSEAKPQLKRVK